MYNQANEVSTDERLKFLKVGKDYSRDYLVMSAMRGPDVEGYMPNQMKRLVTTRLRALVFTEVECQGIYQSEPVSSTELRAFIEDIKYSINTYGDAKRQDLGHFVQHLLDALYMTKTEAIWGMYYNNIADLLRMVRALFDGYSCDMELVKNCLATIEGNINRNEEDKRCGILQP